MNTILLKVLSSALFVVICLSNSANEDISTHTFRTTGNCYICLLTIEDAGNSVAGVTDTQWDVVKDQTEVTYDNTVTDLYTIMKAIANSGYDTEWYPADPTAYQELVGTCCEYVHVIDYMNVQIGYLSIMDIWVYPLSISNQAEISNLNIYPNPSSGMVQIDGSFGNNTVLDIYNLLGEMVASVSASYNGQLDISFLAKGQYVVMLKNDDKIESLTKLIKL